MPRLPRPALALPLLLAWSACGGEAVPPGRSVVLVTCDTLRADRLGLYGCPRGTSPNLDRLARECLVFDAAWSTAPLTGPALSALLTGRLPEELGLRDNRDLLSAEASTLAERLSGAGFDTAAVVSNWVLRRRAELPEAGVQQGFQHFDDRMRSPEPGRPNVMERRADETTDAALAWLDGREDERSFFLWVHYQDPHGPYTPPPDCLGPAGEDGPREAELEVGPDQRGHGTLPRYQLLDGELRPASYRRRYEAEIRFFDRELGRLLSGLRERGLLERSLLVFTADHGESLGEHGYFFSHGQNLHQELVRVPLLLRLPESAAVGARTSAPVSHLDLWPTILEHLGLEPGASHGLDLAGGPAPDDRLVPQSLRGSWSATTAAHRLIFDGTPRLYDRTADPLEEHDIASREPDVVRSLAARREVLLRRFHAPGLVPARPPLDESEQAALQDLGYGGEGDD